MPPSGPRDREPDAPRALDKPDRTPLVGMSAGEPRQPPGAPAVTAVPDANPPDDRPNRRPRREPTVASAEHHTTNRLHHDASTGWRRRTIGSSMVVSSTASRAWNRSRVCAQDSITGQDSCRVHKQDVALTCRCPVRICEAMRICRRARPAKWSSPNSHMVRLASYRTRVQEVQRGRRAGPARTRVGSSSGHVAPGSACLQQCGVVVGQHRRLARERHTNAHRAQPAVVNMRVENRSRQPVKAIQFRQAVVDRHCQAQPARGVVRCHAHHPTHHRPVSATPAGHR